MPSKDDHARSLLTVARMADTAEKEAQRAADLARARESETERLRDLGDAGAAVSERLALVERRHAAALRDRARALKRIAGGQAPYEPEAAQ